MGSTQLQRERLDPDISENSERLAEAAACRQLWLAVMRRAFDDLAYKQRMEDRDRSRLSNFQRARLHQIDEGYPPERFLWGEEFGAVCAAVGVRSAGWVREALLARADDGLEIARRRYVKHPGRRGRG